MNAKAILMQINAIASVTFRELLRERILWSTLIFAMFVLAISFAVAQLSVYEPFRIAQDFGVAAIGLAGGLIAVVVGGSLISREIKDRTLYLVLSKSIWRWQFVLGKAFGLFGVIMLNTAIMYAIVLTVYLLSGGQWHVNFLLNILMQFTEFFMLASIGAFFSSFSTTTLAMVFTFGVWIIGHAMDDARIAIGRIQIPAAREAALYFLKILPDFTVLDIKAQLSHSIPVELGQIAIVVFYGVVYCSFALLGACLIFARRDV